MKIFKNIKNIFSNNPTVKYITLQSFFTIMSLVFFYNNPILHSTFYLLFVFCFLWWLTRDKYKNEEEKIKVNESKLITIILVIYSFIATNVIFLDVLKLLK